ncbi:MAG: 4-oxalocrotonate decarboxylase, partial [Actinomycetia bacterium]|nr:4-oxalocrotonate decarboxylase [Actinomycetes bacterium]
MLDASRIDIGLDEAYRVQDRVHHRLRADSPTVGFKLGYTSQVMREAMGIDEPNHGPLTESMVVRSGTVVSGLLQPKVEPELAVFLDEQGRVERTVASLEVVDSIWQDYEFT